jgi:hypothetical protein
MKQHNSQEIIQGTRPCFQSHLRWHYPLPRYRLVRKGSPAIFWLSLPNASAPADGGLSLSVVQRPKPRPVILVLRNAVDHKTDVYATARHYSVQEDPVGRSATPS